MFLLSGFTRKHGISFHIYVDDIQLYVAVSDDVRPIDVQVRSILDISCWTSQNLLQLN